MKSKYNIFNVISFIVRTLEKNITIIILLLSELKLGMVKKIGWDPTTSKGKAGIQTQGFQTPKTMIFLPPPAAALTEGVHCY
jgi:hypothetical protein